MGKPTDSKHAEDEMPPEPPISESEGVVDEVTGEIVPAQDGKRVGDTGVADYMRSDIQGAEEDSTVAYRRIIDQILAAETVDDILTPIEASSLRDFVGEVLTIHNVTVNKSDYEVGSPFYFSMECVRPETGEKIVVNSGVQRVMAQVVRLNQLGALPQDVRIGQAKKVDKSGKYPLRLEKP